jgi:hypothetical protein
MNSKSFALLFFGVWIAWCIGFAYWKLANMETMAS